MKQTAIIYLRVSTEEQVKGYSLRQQETELTRHCKEKNIEIIQIISEEGQSAKSFKRRSWQAFEESLNIQKNVADLFLVTKIDRFSRNALETRRMVEVLKSKKIRLFSLMEGWFDYSDTKYYLSNTIQAANAEYENMLKANNVIKAMRQGLEEGRWMWAAPKGYKNDTVNKLIYPDEINAPIVRFCFETFAKGVHSAEDVRRLAVQKGLNISKSAFLNLLKNPLYAGKIVRKGYEEDNKIVPEKIVQGIHEPIISEETFSIVQTLLKGKSKKYKGKTRKEELFLRGFLYCSCCGKKMTGSAPRGNGGNYHYYHCQRKFGCKNSISAKVANDIFLEFLEEFQPRKEILALYQALLEKYFKDNFNDIDTEKKMLARQIEEIDHKKEKFVNRFLNSDGMITDTEYRAIMDRLQDEKSKLTMKHATLRSIPSAYQKYLNFGLSLMGNLSHYFKVVDVGVKQQIIGSIFPEKLVFEKNKYRTDKINEFFALYCRLGKDLNKKLPNSIVRQFRVAPPSGLEPETP